MDFKGLRLTLLLDGWQVLDTSWSTEFTKGDTVIRREKKKWGISGRYTVWPHMGESPRIIHTHTPHQALRLVGLYDDE